MRALRKEFCLEIFAATSRLRFREAHHLITNASTSECSAFTAFLVAESSKLVDLTASTKRVYKHLTILPLYHSSK